MGLKRGLQALVLLDTWLSLEIVAPKVGSILDLDVVSSKWTYFYGHIFMYIFLLKLASIFVIVLSMKKLMPLILASIITIFPVASFGMQQIFFDLRPRMSYPDDNGKTITKFIEIKGVYAKIDIAKSQHALEIFSHGSNKEQKEIADRMEKNLGDYNPAALLGLAAYYYMHNNTNRSALISALAHLRMGIDEACSNQDPSVAGVFDLMEYEFLTRLGFRKGSSVDESIQGQFFQLEKRNLEQAITLDKQIGRNYDRRWMYLLGMNAINDLLIEQNNKEPHSMAMIKGKQEQEIIAKIHAKAKASVHK